MAQIMRTGAGWNRDWVAGEHGGESFKTTDAIVDVVNPQQIKVEKVFVGGSRGFADQDAVTRKIASLEKGSVVLVSPTHGATAAVRDAAIKRGLEMHVYTARFEKYPTAEAAYFARDEEMIREADRVVVFWNGCSPGTGHEVEYAKEIGKPIEIYMVDLETKRDAEESLLQPCAMIELMFDRDLAVTEIVAGRCACGGCRGDLTDAALSRGNWRFCRVCRCAWKVSAIDGQTYATAIHTASHVQKPEGSDLRPP